MSIEYIPNTTVATALTLASAFNNAGFTHRTFAIVAANPRIHEAGGPLYRYGGIGFETAEEVRAVICLDAHKVGVNPDNVSGIITDNSISLSFNNPADYLGLMSKIRGTNTVIQGSDYEFQIVGKSESWHETIRHGFIELQNETLKAQGLPQIRCEKVSGVPFEQTNYYFPNLATLQAFHLLVAEYEVAKGGNDMSHLALRRAP